MLERLLDLSVCNDVKCQALALGAILSLIGDEGGNGGGGGDGGSSKDKDKAVIKEMLADGIAFGAIASCF